jgi:hypothetical protein
MIITNINFEVWIDGEQYILDNISYTVFENTHSCSCSVTSDSSTVTGYGNTLEEAIADFAQKVREARKR